MTSSSGASAAATVTLPGSSRKRSILDRLGDHTQSSAVAAAAALAAVGQGQPAFPSLAPPPSSLAVAAGFALFPHHHHHPAHHGTQSGPAGHHPGLVAAGTAFSHSPYPGPQPHSPAAAPHHPLLHRPTPLPHPAPSLEASFGSVGSGGNPMHHHQQLLSHHQQLHQQLAGMQTSCDPPHLLPPSSPASRASSPASMSPSSSSKASSPCSASHATSGGGSGGSGSTTPAGQGHVSRRTPLCSRCSNHGMKNPKKNHPPFCEYRFCTCANCESTAERQDVMARQISNRRAQRNAAAAAAASGNPGQSQGDGNGSSKHLTAAEATASLVSGKRLLSDEERQALFPGFIQYMEGHPDWTYFMMYVTLFRKIGNFKEFEAELKKAEREMAVLESEAKTCKIALSFNLPIKPIPTRHHPAPGAGTGTPGHGLGNAVGARHASAGLSPGSAHAHHVLAANASQAHHHLVGSRVSP